MICDLDDGFGDGGLLSRARGCDVDVVALCADDFAGVVVEAFADDDDLAGLVLCGDDAVAGAEWLVGSANVIEGRRNLFIVFGVLVRQ